MRGRKPENLDRTTAADAPLAPVWLSSEAREEWDRALDLIRDAGAIAQPDADVLAAYCETLVLFKQATKAVADEGITFTSGEDNMIKRHPATSIAAECRKDLLRFAAELGMTPVARHRMKLKASGSNELTDFIGSPRLAQES